MKCPYCDGRGTSNICVNGTFKSCSFCNGTGEVFKCPKCGEYAFLSNWGSLFDHDYAWYNIECKNCGYRADGGTDQQKAIDMFVSGMGDVPKPLTEQEYIQTCDTEQLAEWIAKQKCDGCNDEPYDEKHGTCKYCITKKTEQIREWLKQPHQKE